jgi:hypothetical protein
MIPHSLEQLRALALSQFSREDFSLETLRHIVLSRPLLKQLCEDSDREEIGRWLAQLPCPVIGIGSEPQEPQLYGPCDAVAWTDAELSVILANIERAPLAAMVLVQVLRTTAALPVVDALTVESLAYATLQAGPEHGAWLRTRNRAETAAARTEGPPVLIERAGDRLAIRLNRPERLNALSVEVRDALCEALQLVVADPAIGPVYISGAGRCFSIGGDLSEFGAASDPATAHAVRSVRLPAFFLSRCADRVEFRLHGACIGAGVELPAFAQRVVAARNSFFQLPEIRFGLIPGAGGCVSLPRRIGRQRTAWLALSARRITAATALEWGLVDELVD